MAAAHPLPPAEGSPPPLEELCSPLTRIPRPSAFPPPPSSYKRLSRSNSRRRSSVSSSEGESMLASPAAYLPLRSRTLSIGSQGRAEDDDDEVSCCLSVNSSVAVSGCASTSSLLGDSSGRKRGGGRRRSDAGVDKENLKAQANECMDLRKQLAVEQERRGKAESMVRQLKGQLREYKGKRMSDDEKDKRIDRLLRRLSLVAAELEESRKQARDAEGVHEKAMLELAAVKQGAAKERSQQAQALADLRHASTKRIAELTAECEKLEEAVAEGEGRKADVDKHRDRMVAMEIVIENLTREGKEQTTEKELLQKQVGELKEKLAALEEVKGREIDELKSVEARRTREMLDRIRAVEQELEASQGLHKKYENEVKAAREEAEGVKEEMSQVKGGAAKSDIYRTSTGDD
ncbi:hypothetical protein FOL46_009795 [Perkinsus olseni]|uniref:Uncharacterized protein n=1 Tax=Perkinsus olseni TaxID=32597 RepID=A0A7J6MK69_PEROL|nr:hypothetical protein FOL46_009795 [Perkinsus olseni]